MAGVAAGATMFSPGVSGALQPSSVEAAHAKPKAVGEGDPGRGGALSPSPTVGEQLSNRAPAGWRPRAAPGSAGSRPVNPANINAGGRPVPRGPGSDLCAAAVAISEGTFAFDLSGATNDYPGTCGATASAPDRWWVYTPSSTGTATWSTCGLTSLDTVMTVLDECAGPQITCLDDFCGVQTEVAFTVVAGEDYLLRLAGFNGAIGSGQFVVSLLPSSLNDNCVNAAPLSEFCWYEYDNALATTDGAMDPACGGVQVEQDLWYLLSAECSDTIVLESCGGSGLDTVLAVYDNGFSPTPVCPAMSAIACNDDACGLQSRVAFAPIAGHTYLLRVGSRLGGGGGPGAFRLSCGECRAIGCQPGTREEGESCSADVNGGCNSVTPGAYEAVDCNERLHGTSFALAGVRDTDWYRVTAPASGAVSVGFAADFPCVCFIVDLGSPIPFPCGTVGIVASAEVAPCQTATVSASGLTPGSSYVVFVAPGTLSAGIFDGVPCPANYVLDFDVESGCTCCCPDGTSPIATSYAFRVGGVADGIGPTSIPWSITFPGSSGCLSVSGTAGLPANACGELNADLIAGSINSAASTMALGHIIRARNIPGDASCDDAVLIIDVFGNAACDSCPLTFCVGSPACCIPLNGSCVPAPWSSPTLSAIPLLCADCDGNSVDDRIDALSGTLTDANANGIFDQCEELPLPHPLMHAPLGFPVSRLNTDSALTLGPGNRIDFAAPTAMDRGYIVEAGGFESLGVAVSASLTGVVVDQSQVRFESTGVVNGKKDVSRGSVRIVVDTIAPRFQAFADFSPLGAADVRVVLLNTNGFALSTAIVASNALTPLAGFGTAWPEVEMDAVISELNSCSMVRGTVLRFDAPVTARIEQPGFASVAGIAAIHLIPEGPSLGTLGDLGRVSVSARQLASVSTDHMFAGFFGGAHVVPGEHTILNAPNGSGGAVSAQAAASNGSAEANMTIKVKCAEMVEVSLPIPNGIGPCAFWRVVLCFKIPNSPQPEEPLDPMDFYKTSSVLAGGVDIFVPLCNTQSSGAQACAASAPKIRFRLGDGNTWSQHWECVVPSPIISGGTGTPPQPLVGSVGLWPTMLKENVANGASCISIIFDAGSGQTVPFTLGIPTTTDPNCPNADTHSTFNGAPTDRMLEIQFEGADLPTGALISAIKFYGSGGPPVQAQALLMQLPPRTSDHNGDGTRNSQDFFDYLVAFFSGAAAADFNCDGVVNAMDFFDFLTCFMGGC